MEECNEAANQQRTADKKNTGNSNLRGHDEHAGLHGTQSFAGTYGGSAIFSERFIEMETAHVERRQKTANETHDDRGEESQQHNSRIEGYVPDAREVCGKHEWHRAVQSPRENQAHQTTTQTEQEVFYDQLARQ